MASKIFYSWQSDLPNSTNRNFLENILKQSIKAVATDVGFAAAERDEGLELDKDTKGVPGTPPIVEAIFDKISNCAVFVPDLSFIGSTTDGRGRLLPNPNVLIEYGWALSTVGHSRIVPIMNTAYGEVSMESLPFDMRHRRHPLTYSLADDATNEEKDQVKQVLIKQVSDAILLILQHGTTPTTSIAPALHEPILSTTDPSTFLQEGETLLLFDSFRDTDRGLRLPENQHMYLRIMPIHKAAPLPNAQRAKELLSVSSVRPLKNIYNRNYGRNRHGALVVSHKANNIFGLTQLFLNNELWGIDCFSLDKENLMQYMNIEFGYFPCIRVESTFISTLATYLPFYRDSLKLQPPIKLMAGMTGVKNYKMSMPSGIHSNFDQFQGRVVNENIEFECTIDNLDATPTSILRPFFEHVWEECGLNRPDREKL